MLEFRSLLSCPSHNNSTECLVSPKQRYCMYYCHNLLRHLFRGQVRTKQVARHKITTVFCKVLSASADAVRRCRAHLQVLFASAGAVRVYVCRAPRRPPAVRTLQAAAPACGGGGPGLRPPVYCETLLKLLLTPHTSQTQAAQWSSTWPETICSGMQNMKINMHNMQNNMQDICKICKIICKICKICNTLCILCICYILQYAQYAKYRQCTIILHIILHIGAYMSKNMQMPFSMCKICKIKFRFLLGPL